MVRQREFDTDEVLAIAMNLFWQRGYINTSMKDIVQATGVQFGRWIGIAANYLYPVGVMQLFLQRIMFPITGNETDETVVEGVTEAIAQQLKVIERELINPFLVSETLSLAISSLEQWCITPT